MCDNHDNDPLSFVGAGDAFAALHPRRAQARRAQASADGGAHRKAQRFRAGGGGAGSTAAGLVCAGLPDDSGSVLDI